MIFFYDSSRQALVYPAPPDGRQLAFPVRALKALGWVGDEADYARALPRFGKSLIEPATPAHLSALGRVHR